MPGKPQGAFKSGGRDAGTHNRKTASKKEDLLKRIELIELELDLPPGTLHPVEGLARIAGNPKTPLDIRVDCLKSIAPYCVPKLATVTVKGDEENPIVVEHVNIDRLLIDPQLLAAAQKIALAVEDNVETYEVASEPKLIEQSPE